MITFATNRSANTIVQRSRLRSTSEPPPNGPAPVPTPNAPESPASLPECSRTSRIRMIETKTWNALRTASSTTDTLAAATRVELVQPLEDRDRLRAPLTVGRAVVVLRELAHPEVELRV